MLLTVFVWQVRELGCDRWPCGGAGREAHAAVGLPVH